MRITFWILFGFGSALLVVSVLGSQVPGNDRTLDKALFSTTGLLLAGSLALGGLSRGTRQWRAGSIPRIILSAELLLCLYGLVSVLTYR
jgi:hypothetical protein